MRKAEDLSPQPHPTTDNIYIYIFFFLGGEGGGLKMVNTCILIDWAPKTPEYIVYLYIALCTAFKFWLTGNSWKNSRDTMPKNTTCKSSVLFNTESYITNGYPKSMTGLSAYLCNLFTFQAIQNDVILQ